MASRSRATFQKRQKEQARQEKQRAKLQRKLQRKLENQMSRSEDATPLDAAQPSAPDTEQRPAYGTNSSINPEL
jgi:hypothetical protein